MNIVYMVIIGSMLFFLVGTTFTGFVMDVGYYIMCLGCSEGAVAVQTGLAQLITAGQSNIKEGVMTIVDLRDNIDLQAAIDSGFMTEAMAQAQIDTARFKIFGGIALTFGMWFIIFFAISRFYDVTAGWSPPLIMALLLTIGIVGIVSWAAIGFVSSWEPYVGPYDGFVTLFFNWDIWWYQLIESVAPVPPEAMNLTDPGNFSL